MAKGKAVAEVFQDRAGGWRFRIVGANGETMAPSQAYSRQEDAERGVSDLAGAFGGKAPEIVVLAADPTPERVEVAGVPDSTDPVAQFGVERAEDLGFDRSSLTAGVFNGPIVRHDAPDLSKQGYSEKNVPGWKAKADLQDIDAAHAKGRQGAGSPKIGDGSENQPVLPVDERERAAFEAQQAVNAENRKPADRAAERAARG